ncbi:MAG: hypothetical protein U9R60_12620, partial [Bacteroidota bacterium]|nr:hypothetical protein [Bacteroidota bacterium]
MIFLINPLNFTIFTGPSFAHDTMRVKILIPFALFLLPFIFYGQTYIEMSRINFDSLQQQLPDLSGTERIDVLNKIAFASSPYHPDSSIRIANLAKLDSEKTTYRKGIADAHFSLGITYLFLDSLKFSVINLLEALRIYEELEPCKEMGFTLEQLQAINFLTGRYEKSKNYGRKAVRIFHLLGDSLHMVRRLYALGLTCTENNEFDSAKYYNEYALEIIPDKQDSLALLYRASIYL